MTLLSAVIGRGLLAARPAAGTAGALYFATDDSGGRWSRDNGTTWDVTDASGSGGSSTLAGDSDVAIATPANLDLLQYSTSDSKWHNLPLLTTVTSVLAADVAVTPSSTFKDGPSVSLAAGTWFVTGHVQVTSLAACEFIGRLYDGTTVYRSGETYCDGNGPRQLVLTAKITVSATTTITFQVEAISNTGSIKATTQDGSQGNNASALTAIRIA